MQNMSDSSCTVAGITLNRSKWVKAQPSVEFAGFQLSQEHITLAIANFPTPSSRTDLRSFIGLTNQLSASTNTFAQAHSDPSLAPRMTLCGQRSSKLPLMMPSSPSHKSQPCHISTLADRAWDLFCDNSTETNGS